MIPRLLKWTLASIIVTGLIFISWPKFEAFQCRSIQSEAKAQLSHLYEAEQFYFAHHHSYTSLEMLIQEGLIKSNEKNYTYKTSYYDDKTFEIVATSKTLNQDVWSINQADRLQSIKNACTFK
ncbi:MAG: hypothetical protein WCK49_00580 [Myxococcaceae bacterium]